MKNVIDLTKPIPEILWDMYQYIRSIEEMDYDENFPTDTEISNLRCLSSYIFASLQDFVPTAQKQVRIKLEALKDQAEKYKEEMSDCISQMATQILKSKAV